MSCLTQPSPTPTEQPAPIATQDPTPTSTATATPSSTPTTVPTATSTVSPTPTVTPTATNSFPSRVQTSALTHDFGAIGISEIRYFNFILKPDQGVPAVTGVQLHSSNGISVLSPSSMTARGVVPCNGTMDRYCGITVRAEGITLGAKEASFSVNLVDESDPNIVETVGPFNVRATVQSSPVISDSQFRTVSFKQKAQQAGLTPVQYLINQYNRAKPTSFRVDTTNIHSSAVSDALIFDQYGSPSTAINWRNNWLNTLFDFSASAWDTYGGAAPDYLGPYSQGGAAITRCHIATAKHYPRGGGFTFHRRSGEAAWFNIVGQADTPTYDIRIYRIDPCLPPEYPIYPLLDPSDLEGGTSLVGAPYFGNHFNVSDFIRRGSILQIGFHSTTHIGGTATSLAPSSMQVTAQVGDSGSPTFIYFDGELVLMSTYTNGGWGSGPFYGSAAVQQELRNALETLANQ